jgi:hypothetical protein
MSVSLRRNNVVPIYFNSKDRININDSTSNFTIKLRKTLRNIGSISVTNIGIPTTFTNIGFNKNTLQFIFFDNGPPAITAQIVITLSSLNYTFATLATELSTQLNQNLVSINYTLVWSVVYNDVSNKYIISVLYPSGSTSTTGWGFSLLFSALVDVIGIGNGDTATQTFNSILGSDKLVIPVLRAAILENNIHINITSETLSAGVNTSYIQNYNKVFSVTDNNNNLKLLTTKTFSNYVSKFPRGSGTIGGMQLGLSVAMSDSGLDIVAGASYDSPAGSVNVFRKNISGIQWVQLPDKLLPVGATGSQVTTGVEKACAISRDGKYIVFGDPYYGGNVGSIWIYKASGDVWGLMKQFQGINVANSLGRALAINGDGSVIVTSSVFSTARQVYVYRRTDSRWILDQQITVTGFTFSTSAIRSGHACTISSDGLTFSVSSADDGPVLGAIAIYNYINGVWVQQTILRRSTFNTGDNAMGYNMAVSLDGNTIIAGGSIRATIWTRSGGIPGTWAESAQLIADDLVRLIGKQVSISGDGRTAVVSNPDISPEGFVYIFVLNLSNVWVGQAAFTFSGGTSVSPSFFGSSHALSFNGNTLSIGANGWYKNSGSVWVYNRSAINVWSKTQGPTLLTNGFGLVNETQALKISSSGNAMISGGSTDSINIGAGWLYYRAGTSFVQVGVKLQPFPDTTVDPVGRGIGTSVCMNSNGSLFGLGAPLTNGIGSVLIYSWNPATPTVPAVYKFSLQSTNRIGASRQGSAVAMSSTGSVLIVGGNGDNNFTGAVWIYNYNGTSYIEQTKIVGSNFIEKSIMNQGISVAINSIGNMMVFAGQGTNVENIHVFWIYWKAGSGNWNNIQFQVINDVFRTAPTGETFVNMNTSVDMDSTGNIVVCGTPRSTNRVTNNYIGNIRVFEFDFDFGLYIGKTISYPIIPYIPAGLLRYKVGCSVSISPDGLYIAVGENNSDSLSKYIYMYKKSTLGVWSAIPTINAPITLDISRAGNPVTLATLNNIDYILVSGSVSTGGWYKISGIIVANNIVSVTIPPRSYIIYDIINALNILLTGSDISYSVGLVAGSDTILISSINNSNVSSIFTVDPSSSFDKLILFDKTDIVKTTSKQSSIIDFTINNNIIRTVNSHRLSTGSSLIYDDSIITPYRNLPAGFTINKDDIIDIQLRDERDRLIDLINANWIMTINFTIYS